MVTENIIFATTTPTLALGLDALISNYAVVCTDDSSVVDLLIQKGIPVFCLERHVGDSGSINRNTYDLLSHPDTQKFIKQFEPVSILVFKNSASIEQLCHKQGWNLLASDATIGRKYENKVAFPKILETLNLKHPPMVINRVRDLQYDLLCEKLGVPFVFQYAKGFSGRDTYLVSNYSVDHLSIPFGIFYHKACIKVISTIFFMP